MKHKAVEKAAQSPERLRDLIDGLGPSMFVGLMTPEGILIEANRPALAAAGLRPEDVLGKSFEDTYWWAYSDAQQQLREAIARGARGEASRYDVRVRAADKEFIDIDFSLQPLRNGIGEVVFLVPSAIVITARKQAEADLQRSEREQRQIARQLGAEKARLLAAQSLARVAGRLARIGAWRVDLSDMRCTWSDEVCAIHGMPAGHSPTVEEALTFCAPEFRPIVERTFDACARQGRPTTWSSDPERLRRARLGSQHRRSRTRCHGGVRWVQGAFQDISDRKHAAEETRALAERLSTTFEHYGSFVIVDRDWRFRFVNREAERLLQRTREDLIGRDTWTEFPATVGSTFEREYRRAMADNQTVAFEEFYPPLNTWFAIQAYPSEQGLAVYFRDVSAARQAREALSTNEVETRRANEILAGNDGALQDITAASLTLPEMMTLIATRAQALTDATGGLIELLEGEEMVSRAGSGTGTDIVGLRVPRACSLSGLAVQSGTALISEDTETDDRVNRAVCRKVGVRSMVVAPLQDGQQVVGVLKVMSGQPGAFSQRDVNNLQILVESLGAVIQRQGATERLRASEAQYRLLFASNPHPMWAYELKTLRSR
jgi:PAS domain S-box-containing protein